MTLVVRLDPPADGPANMAADDLLAEGLPAGGVAMRFYGWRETTLSLGAFQRFDEIAAVPGLAGLPVVRRPSGGGAILHGSDLTYAIAVCRSHAWGCSPQPLYDAVHAAAVELLRSLSLDAMLFPSGNVADDPIEPFLCFERRSTGDVVCGSQKVLGSAQRRHRAAVVQHGSLLVRRPVVPTDGGDVGAWSDHRGVEGCLGRPFDLDAFARDWAGLVGRAAGLGVRFERGDGAAPRPGGEAARERYRDEGWTRRR